MPTTESAPVPSRRLTPPPPLPASGPNAKIVTPKPQWLGSHKSQARGSSWVQESGLSPPNTETHQSKEPCLSPRTGHPVFGNPPAVRDLLCHGRREPPLRAGQRPCSLWAHREQTGKEGPCHPELSLHAGRQFRPREQVARATKRVRCRQPPGAARARGRAEGLGELGEQPEKGARPMALGA